MRTHRPHAPPWRWRVSGACMRAHGALSTPTHAASLGAFRAAVGVLALLMLGEMNGQWDELSSSYITLPVYAGTQWVRPVAPVTGTLIWAAAMIAAVLLVVGLFSRAATWVFAACLAYLTHVCASFGSAATGPLCRVAFAGCFVSWGRWGAVDAANVRHARKGHVAHVPLWHLRLVQAVVLIPYFRGVLLEANSDWLLRAQPLRSIWAGSFARGWAPLAVAWGSFTSGMLIPALLLSPQWLRSNVGIPLAVLAHLGAGIAYGETLTPLFFLASLLLFAEPHWPALGWARFAGVPAPLQPPRRSVDQEENGEDVETPDSDFRRKGPLPSLMRPSLAQSRRVSLAPSSPPIARTLPGHIPQRERVTAGRALRYALPSLCVGALLLGNIAWPPTQLQPLSGATTSWTDYKVGGGSWHARIAGMEGFVVIITGEENGNVEEFHPALDMLLTPRQQNVIMQVPEALLRYMERLTRVFEASGRKLSAMHVKSCYRLNGRPGRELFDSDMNVLDSVRGPTEGGEDAASPPQTRPWNDAWRHAVRRAWVRNWRDAPTCHVDADPRGDRDRVRRIHQNFSRLQQAAGLEQADLQGSSEVFKLLEAGEKEYAYLWTP